MVFAGVAEKCERFELECFSGGEKMQLEANQISRDWTILHEGRKFYVNYTQSDGQTLALCNRDNWEVLEETDDGPQELDIYGFESDGPDGQAKTNANFKLMKELIRFCIKNWDNQFMQEIKGGPAGAKGGPGATLRTHKD
jgi:hypothetical protein